MLSPLTISVINDKEMIFYEWNTVITISYIYTVGTSDYLNTLLIWSEIFSPFDFEMTSSTIQELVKFSCAIS